MEYLGNLNEYSNGNKVRQMLCNKGKQEDTIYLITGKALVCEENSTDIPSLKITWEETAGRSIDSMQCNAMRTFSKCFLSDPG